MGFITIWFRMYFEFIILIGLRSVEEVFKPLTGYILPQFPIVLILFLLSLLFVKWFRKIGSLKGFILGEVGLLLMSVAAWISLVGVGAQSLNLPTKSSEGV